MLRYYLIAALIVVAVGSVVFAHRLAPPDLRIVAQATGTPTVESSSPPDAKRAAVEFSASGSWVLSALPDCFDERSRVRGPAAAVVAQIPPPTDRIAPGTVLAAGPCAVEVRADEIWVRRSGDRLRVPADARLYRADGLLVVVVRTADVVEIRQYRTPEGAPR